jgi:hypothetical protein
MLRGWSEFVAFEQQHCGADSTASDPVQCGGNLCFKKYDCFSGV